MIPAYYWDKEIKKDLNALNERVISLENRVKTLEGWIKYFINQSK